MRDGCFCCLVFVIVISFFHIFFCSFSSSLFLLCIDTVYFIVLDVDEQLLICKSWVSGCLTEWTFFLHCDHWKLLTAAKDREWKRERVRKKGESMAVRMRMWHLRKLFSLVISFVVYESMVYDRNCVQWTEQVLFMPFYSLH